MSHLDDFDPSLFGTWSARADYDGRAGREDAALADEVRDVLLETKSAEGGLDPADELRRLLNEMTVEIREQFSTFRRLRTAAEQALEHGDDAAQKLARADVKAATDAMSLIVRTLEKVDALQRQLARDRALEAERVADEGGYGEAKARFMRMIEERALEKAIKFYEAWQQTGPPDGLAARFAGGPSQPESDPAAGGEDGLEDGAAGEVTRAGYGSGQDGA
jgi:hypothetical protein